MIGVPSTLGLRAILRFVASEGSSGRTIGLEKKIVLLLSAPHSFDTHSGLCSYDDALSKRPMPSRSI
jgi:hypothetical protein